MKNKGLDFAFKLTVLTVLILGTISLIVGCNTSGKTDSGIISFVIIPEVTDTSMNPLLTGFLTSMKYDMASDGKKAVVYSQNMQGKLRKFLINGKAGQIWYAEDSYGKFKVEVSNLNLQNILDKNKNGYKVNKAKTKEILGFKCYLVTLNVGANDDLQKIEAYVTDKIDFGFKQPLGFNLDIPGLDDTILEAKFIPEKVSAKNIGFTLAAKNFTKLPPKELLEQPSDEDFESITFESYVGKN